MNTELNWAICSKTATGNYLIDDKPACLACVIAKATADTKAQREEDRAEARANDTDYDSDDWTSEDEEEEEESCVATIWYGP